MIGSLFYIGLDIAFNVAWWVTAKGFSFIYGVGNTIYYYNNEEIEDKDLKILRERVEKQDELIKELKSKIDEKKQLDKVLKHFDISLEPCLEVNNDK